MSVIVNAINWFGALPGPVMMFLIFLVISVAVSLINKSDVLLVIILLSIFDDIVLFVIL